MELLVSIVVAVLLWLISPKKTKEFFTKTIPTKLRQLKVWFSKDKHLMSTDGPMTNSDEFIGREKILNDIFTRLKAAKNTVLVAPEKMGKSSLLHQVCHLASTRLPEKAFVYLNVQTTSDENDFYNALCREFQLDKKEIPNCRGNTFFHALKAKPKSFVLCLDETAYMKNGEQFKRSVRDQLRA